MAVKTVSEPEVLIDFWSSGISRWRRQIIDTNIPRFNESPTYIILFPLNVSNISVALNLRNRANTWNRVVTQKQSEQSLRGKIAVIGLPPPELVIFVGTTVFLTRKLRLNVRTLPFLVRWSGDFVSHPFPVEYVTVFLCFTYSKRNLLHYLVLL